MPTTRDEDRQNMTSRAPIAVALDAPDLDTAARWADLVTPHVSTLKVGLELYLRFGPEAVASVRGPRGVDVFLDLKLHDIPATVGRAARAVAKVRPDLLTVHAAAGAAAIESAVQALPDTRIVAVTILTSLSNGDLGEIGMAGPVSDAVLRLAVLAVAARAPGPGCSPQEGAAVRAEVGPGLPPFPPPRPPPGEARPNPARGPTPQSA